MLQSRLAQSSIVVPILGSGQLDAAEELWNEVWEPLGGKVWRVLALSKGPLSHTLD